MRVLCFFLLLHAVVAQTGFGTSYLGKSKLCHQWNCLNQKLGLPDALPPKERYAAVLSSLVPEGPWQAAVGPALDVCYGPRPRRYTNTCPGQALMQCAVEQLMQNCPEGNLRKEDACAPVSSLAGFKYLFSQSRYDNLEKNMPTERRPSWFLTNYFNMKCCDLPELFNSSVLAECGVDNLMHYYVHSPQPARFGPSRLTTTTPKNTKETVKVVDLPMVPVVTEAAAKGDTLKIVDLPVISSENTLDPLDCCDVSEFLSNEWRTECGFKLRWAGPQRLQILDQGLPRTTAVPTTTTTVRPVKHNDVKIVPQPCDIENCIFKDLNIVSEDGAVDKDAFSKLLDNMTSVHTAWTKAKARVVTTCLSRPLTDYEDDCEINKVLSCTFDVLSENCPYAKKADPCKHSSVLREDMSCQISASKYRPKNRRQFCGMPSLVRPEVLSKCGGKPVTRMEYVPEPPTPTRPHVHTWRARTPSCKETTESTQCMMDKMDVLNKYGFLDYFKMKDRMRQFSGRHEEWAVQGDVHMAAFLSAPAFYRDQCNSPKKFLNVIDSMLMTCPVSRRKFTVQCNKVFRELNSALLVQQNITKERVDHIIHYLQKVFLHKTPKLHAGQDLLFPKIYQTRPKLPIPKPTPIQPENPYAFGLLNSKDAPRVKIVKIKPSVMYKKPLIMLPVYRRLSNGRPGKMNFALTPHGDGIFRSAPFMLHNVSQSGNIGNSSKIAQP